MAGEKLFGDSNLNVLLQNGTLPSSDVLRSLWCPNSSSPAYHGSKSMVNFENGNGGSNAKRQIFQSLDKDDTGDGDYDGCLPQPGKKRRLTADQVEFLERNFEIENKLEPERKVQLAKELGLQPRQVAIWFQNRRARFKTKQLEKDYDCLKAGYDKLKADFDNLLKEKEKLKNEVISLKGKLLIRDENQEHLNHDSTKSSKPETAKASLTANIPENVPRPPVVACKQEEASSAKSDVFDSDSPHYTAGSSNVFEHEHSDFSQDDDDSPGKSILPLPQFFPKLEDGSSILGFAAEDQLFCFWP